MNSPFSHCHACGTAYATDRWPRVCLACGTVHYRNPPPVGVALLPVSGFAVPHVLITQRAIAPCLGQWALPGGFAEEGESCEGTAQREVREETGLDLPLEGFTLFHSAPSPGGLVLVFSIGPVITPDQVQGIQPCDETLAARAAPVKDLALCFPLHTAAVAHYAQFIGRFK
jgi:ADP-ribose pyrophosphatase YjhB (NUDIX family)